MTLLFGFAQTVVCADADAALILPIIGRILDWHKAKLASQATNLTRSIRDQDLPSITKIRLQDHCVSFRNTGKITELAGCDRLTISLGLLEDLTKSTSKLDKKL